MRQHQKALFLPGDGHAEAVRLEPVRLESGELSAHDEAWLRDLMFRHPELLPIGEIEPVLSDAKAVCTELPTLAGLADLLLVTSTGGLVLIECKL